MLAVWRLTDCDDRSALAAQIMKSCAAADLTVVRPPPQRPFRGVVLQAARETRTHPHRAARRAERAKSSLARGTRRPHGLRQQSSRASGRAAGAAMGHYAFHLRAGGPIVCVTLVLGLRANFMKIFVCGDWCLARDRKTPPVFSPPHRLQPKSGADQDRICAPALVREPEVQQGSRSRDTAG
jgi:hypothetical protein